jgi:uncharacterized protein YcbX
VPVQIGQIDALFRYPVKSMRGERLDAAHLGWHGIDGDRRLAFRRLDDASAFPWLTASRVPELILYTPRAHAGDSRDALPTHVRTPDGAELPVFGDALAADIGRRYGSPVQMMNLRNGIFDDASLSVITSNTVREVTRAAGVPADVRRFRPNIVIRSLGTVPFEEEDWLGGVLTFGDAVDAASMAVTMPDVRCAMVNIDPDHGTLTPDVLKAAVRIRQNNAGVYGTVTRAGSLAVGQIVQFQRA